MQLLVECFQSNKVITRVNLHDTFRWPCISPKDWEQLDSIPQVNKYRPRVHKNAKLNVAAWLKHLTQELYEFQDKLWLLYYILHNNVDIIELGWWQLVEDGDMSQTSQASKQRHVQA